MRDSTNRPSRLEWEILEIIFSRFGGRPVTVREVLNTAYPDNSKAYTTVQTVMNKLVEKKLLKKEKTGLVNFYQPVREQQELLQSEIQSFLNKAFAGSFKAMVSFLFSNETITQEEIESLRELIEKSEGEK
jgi:BlaI family penicillinase repressor